MWRQILSWFGRHNVQIPAGFGYILMIWDLVWWDQRYRRGHHRESPHRQAIWRHMQHSSIMEAKKWRGHQNRQCKKGRMFGDGARWPSFPCVYLARVWNVLHPWIQAVEDVEDEARDCLPPLVPGRPKTDMQYHKAYVSQMSPLGRTVQGGGVYLYRLLKTAEILQASSRPGRCDENFRDGSDCAASRRLFAYRQSIEVRRCCERLHADTMMCVWHTHITHKSIWINKSSVYPKSTQLSTPDEAHQQQVALNTLALVTKRKWHR